MKFFIFLIGLLTLLGGLLPFLKDNNFMPGFLAWAPTSGMGYQLSIIILGVIGIVYGAKARRDFGSIMRK